MLEIKYSSKHYEVKDLKIRENQCNFSQNIGFQRALKQNMAWKLRPMKSWEFWQKNCQKIG